MNNTIHTVPRELLERVTKYCVSAPDAIKARNEVRALLSAPSPAGVDGLEVVGWQQRYIDPDEGVSAWGYADARTASILQGRSDYELRPLYAAPVQQVSVIVPTHQMILAGEDQWERSGNEAPDVSTIFLAMLAAAPAAPAADAGLVEALEKLARLGNGDKYGNSEGNFIAQAALAAHRAQGVV